MTQEKKLSLDVKARIANGRSRACGKCYHFPCGEVLSAICSKAFIEGFKKVTLPIEKRITDDQRL